MTESYIKNIHTLDNREIGCSNHSEKLDLIDSILSQFETVNENEEMSVSEEHVFKVNPAIQKIKDQNVEKIRSPLIAENSQPKNNQTQSLETPSNLLKKSKSFQLCSTPKIYNTQVTKELEILNLLYLNGKLNDNSSQTLAVPVNFQVSNSQENIHLKKVTSECKMSPIITSTIKLTQVREFQDSLRNQGLDSPKLDYSLTLPDTKEQNNLLENNETINRNLNFDESTMIESRPQNRDKSESADEDEQLLAHMTKLEKSNCIMSTSKTSIQDISKNSNHIGFQEKVAKKESIDFVDQRYNHLKVDEIKNESSFKLPKVNMENFGFQTAGGRNISIKEASLKLAKEKIWDKEQESEQTDSLTNNFSGFQTARGNKISINVDALKVAQEKLSNETESSLNSNKQNVDFLSCGFQTAKGNKIKVSDDALKFAREKILDRTDQTETINFNKGFKTVSGKSIKINESTLNDARKKFESSNEISNVDLMNCGFKTATGKNINVKEDSLKLAKEKLNSLESDFNTVANFSTDFKNVHEKQIEIKKDTFETMKISFKPKDSKNDEDLLNNIPYKENVKVPKPIINNLPSTLNVKKMLDGKHFKKPQLVQKSKLNKYIETPTINDDSMNKTEDFQLSIKNLFKEDLSPKSNEDEENCYTPTSSNHSEFKFEFNSVKLNDYLKENECLFNPQNQHKLTYLNVNNLELMEVSGDQSDSKLNCCRYLVKPILELKIAEVNYSSLFFDEINHSDEIKYSSDDKIKNFEKSRFDAFKNQLKRLELKKAQTLRPNERSKAGHLLNFKNKNKSMQLSLKNFKINESLENSASQVLYDDILELKFSFQDFFIHEKENSIGYVKTCDGGCLVPDENLNIGINELFNCFLDTNGVDGKLVDIAWFKNHFKWIIWKLNSYDRKFPESFCEKKVLNPLNVLMQLKYRYDMEIGNAKRSCIKRITEKDDTSSNKLIILFISNILNKNSNMNFIELSDGWYSIKALCDSYLSEYLSKKRLKIGDKLAIYSADLYGCPKDGCLPLEAPDDLYLKLSANSTRKAKWFTKLGFYKSQRPLVINLNTIKSNSNVGAIDVLVERIYPMQYFETKQDGTKVCRNQKQEELLNYKSQTDYENFNFNNEIDYDTSECEKKFNNHSNQRSIQISKQPVKRDVKQILKIRLKDALAKKEKGKSETCVLTVWQNASDLQEKLKEGERLTILNVTSSKSSYQEFNNICLSTNRQTRYVFNKKNSNQVSTRQNYPFSDLYNQRIISEYNEVDTCGVVFFHSTNTYQDLVYMSNLAEDESTICLCFPKNSEFYGFKDSLKCFNVVACLNLRFTNRKELSKYPCLLASELSIFSQRINGFRFLSNAFNSLNEIASKVQNKSRLVELASSIEEEKKCYVQQPLNNSTYKINHSCLNESSSELLKEIKANKLLAVAQNDDLPPLIPTKSGSRHPGLVPKNKQFPNTSINKSLNESSLNKSNQNRSLKRTSETFDQSNSMNLADFSKNEEDEEDAYIKNQDLEALCKNKTKKIKMDS